MTPQQLAQALGVSFNRANLWAQPITGAMAEFGVDSFDRRTMFVAQIGHESGLLRYTAELWGPTPAQSRYEDRADLGNVQPGDGYRFRGRGLIQITGRANYKAAASALSLPLIDHPELLEVPQHAVRSAAWWWQAHGCSELADGGGEAALIQVTRRINGGLNGLDARRALYLQAREFL